ncbi:MAG: hypothetical protein CMM21_00850 [Rhodospirillaceae bacterium]|jgi:ketosteroid isomerase-like protein|nr:hypothetical protein [Rhodospirillaceae bacterium]MDP6267412.1 nuclear transport factor 2 family protein [Arenicellales bacterium]|tara:strand:+ start:5288 stop:5728 length:441 start_codon:yes stop_codon:yes gene_type:complete
MERDEVIAVVNRFLEANCRAARGEPVDPLADLHDDLAWTMTGNTTVARTYSGLDDFRTNIGKAMSMQFRSGEGFGLNAVEYIVEGNRVAVVIKGRGEGFRGATYNNNYFFFIEVRDDKIFSVIESCDGSLVWRSACDTHLEESNGS